MICSSENLRFINCPPGCFDFIIQTNIYDGTNFGETVSITTAPIACMISTVWGSVSEQIVLAIGSIIATTNYLSKV